jgi:hypothetical protein
MTLSSHLKSPDSPIRKCLEQIFPILQLSTRGSPDAKAYSSILGFDNLAPCSLPTLAPKSNQGTIGTAVDYRLRYYFRSYDQHETVAGRCVGKLRGALPALASLGSKFLDHQWELVKRLNPSGRQLNGEDEAALNAGCVVLTLFEQICRSGQVYPPLNSLAPRAKLTDLLALVQPEVVQDINQLSLAFSDDAKGLFNLRAILNPTFQGSADVGGADADIIVDRTLIDFKCLSKSDAMQLRAAVLQLLGYVLLDYDDRYSICELAVYLPRQRQMWQAPLWRFVLAPEEVQSILKSNTPPNMDVMAKQLHDRRSDFSMVAKSLNGVQKRIPAG